MLLTCACKWEPVQACMRIPPGGGNPKPINLRERVQIATNSASGSARALVVRPHLDAAPGFAPPGYAAPHALFPLVPAMRRTRASHPPFRGTPVPIHPVPRAALGCARGRKGAAGRGESHGPSFAEYRRNRRVMDRDFRFPQVADHRSSDAGCDGVSVDRHFLSDAAERTGVDARRRNDAMSS